MPNDDDDSSDDQWEETEEDEEEEEDEKMEEDDDEDQWSIKRFHQKSRKEHEPGSLSTNRDDNRSLGCIRGDLLNSIRALSAICDEWYSFICRFEDEKKNEIK